MNSMAVLKTPLLVFGEDWGGLPSSTQHFIKHLSNDRKVIWVNSIGLRQPRFSLHDVKRVFLKLSSKFVFKPKVDSVTYSVRQALPENISLVNPLTIPAPKSKLARAVAKWLLKRQLLPVIKKVFDQPFILWTSLPTAVDLVGELNEQSVIYYCGDDFSALAGVDHQVVALREQELIEKADLIFTINEGLKNQFAKDNVHTLPHGVDFDLFHQLCPKALDLPNDSRPIAGFYGSISEWLDQTLLSQVIAGMPDWHFVFIGNSVVNTERLSVFENVHFLGPKSHDQLPGYSQHWQVSILPFVLNGQIQACNPLKLREYLATGTPVVSTRFNAVEEYSDVVSIVDNAEEMQQALRQSLHDEQRSKRSQTVASESWTSRAQTLSDLIQNLSK
jgi:glycosyltransferase involved in cell wall biosynthesis